MLTHFCNIAIVKFSLNSILKYEIINIDFFLNLFLSVDPYKIELTISLNDEKKSRLNNIFLWRLCSQNKHLTALFRIHHH